MDFIALEDDSDFYGFTDLVDSIIVAEVNSRKRGQKSILLQI